MSSAHLTLFPFDVRVEIIEGQTIRDALLAHGIVLDAVCGGFARCGLCKIKILDGFEYLSVMEHKEISMLGTVFHITHERLACQTKVYGDVTCDISNHSMAMHYLTHND